MGGLQCHSSHVRLVSDVPAVPRLRSQGASNASAPRRRPEKAKSSKRVGHCLGWLQCCRGPATPTGLCVHSVLDVSRVLAETGQHLSRASSSLVLVAFQFSTTSPVSLEAQAGNCAPALGMQGLANSCLWSVSLSVLQDFQADGFCAVCFSSRPLAIKRQ